MVKVRFAPSPTGSLHLGTARTAVVNWLFARSRAGELVLRIDDTDPSRSRKESESEILAELAWLGIDWDHGPVYQSQTLAALGDRQLLSRVVAGDFAYEDGGAYWFRVPDKTIAFDDAIRGRIEFPPGSLKDFVVLRSDGTPTYNLAAAVDDFNLGITHVLRGEDHISNTPLQILLVEALGGRPPIYAHLPLLLGPDGSKLSKRHDAASIAEYKKHGYLASAIVNYLALVTYSLGKDEVLEVKDLIARFELGAVHRAAGRFDRDKLRWLNGQHLRRMPRADFGQAIGPWLRKGDVTSAELEALQTAGATLEECAQAATLFDRPGEPDAGAYAALRRQGAAVAVTALAEELPAERIDIERARELLYQVREGLKERGIAPKVAMRAIRAALTGTTVGPELHYFLAALPPEELRRRLRR